MSSVFPRRAVKARAKALPVAAMRSLAEPLPAGSTALFVLALPLELAPTMNAYSSMPGWARGRLRTAVDWMIAATVAKQGKPLAGGARRRVVVTRHSSREVDDCAVDVLGGKVAVDRLVVAGILAGDSRKWLEREPRWSYAKPGQGRLVVEVHECGAVATVGEDGISAREAGPEVVDYMGTGVQRKRKAHHGA